jgi:hypothetical protein
MFGLLVAEVPTIAMSASVAEVAGELQDLVALAVTAHVDQVTKPACAMHHADRHEVVAHDLAPQRRQLRQRF